MCYSSRADFGWDTGQDAVRKPEVHRKPEVQLEPAPPQAATRKPAPVAYAESHSHADDTRLWAFLASRKEPRSKEVHAPGTVPDRIGEKV
ncbi:hypothetical protein ACFUTU_15145 [Arthrobacter sp. NPDC057388]|uniref:hypothetical protein n=1 Tax=Arthrobacter sp. NPDC057388 TaxID=3346116 RepID=UPI00363A9FBA